MTKALDLHGIKHEDVDRIVENYVLLNEPPLTIITGLSDKMKKIVVSVLEKHEIQHEISILNPGQISINSW